MTETTIKIRQVEIRKRFAAIAESADAVPETEVTELRTEIVDLDNRLAILSQANDGKTEVTEPDPELRDDKFNGLLQKVEIRSYIEAYVNEKPLDGPAAEVSKELRMVDNQVPWAVLCGPEPQVEQRADVISSQSTLQIAQTADVMAWRGSSKVQILASFKRQCLR